MSYRILNSITQHREYTALVFLRLRNLDGHLRREVLYGDQPHHIYYFSQETVVDLQAYLISTDYPSDQTREFLKMLAFAEGEGRVFWKPRIPTGMTVNHPEYIEECEQTFINFFHALQRRTVQAGKVVNFPSIDSLEISRLISAYRNISELINTLRGGGAIYATCF